MINDARLRQLIFAAEHNGLYDETAVKYFRGVVNGPAQIKVTCAELKELLGAYLERRTTAAGNHEESVQDCTGATDKVSK